MAYKHRFQGDLSIFLWFWSKLLGFMLLIFKKFLESSSESLFSLVICWCFNCSMREKWQKYIHIWHCSWNNEYLSTVHILTYLSIWAFESTKSKKSLVLSWKTKLQDESAAVPKDFSLHFAFDFWISKGFQETPTGTNFLPNKFCLLWFHDFFLTLFLLWRVELNEVE